MFCTFLKYLIFCKNSWRCRFSFIYQVFSIFQFFLINKLNDLLLVVFGLISSTSTFWYYPIVCRWYTTRKSCKMVNSHWSSFSFFSYITADDNDPLNRPSVEEKRSNKPTATNRQTTAAIQMMMMMMMTNDNWRHNIALEPDFGCK